MIDIRAPQVRRSAARLAAPALALALLSAACSGSGDASPTSPSPALSSPTPTATAATQTPAVEERVENGVTITSDPRQVIRSFSMSGWKTDFTRHTVPYSEIFSGGPPKDGIPPIDEPRFITFAEANERLLDDEPIAYLEINGDARAYPLQILIWHEIVNDVIGGEPVVVTFCPLCNTTLSFRRTFDGQVLDFGTTGNLRHSDLVMYDRQTETWWQQATGEGIIGSYAGRKLEFVPSSVISYSDFKASFPQGKVLSRNTGHFRPYGSNPYINYDDTGSTPFLYSGPFDSRLSVMERVVTVDLDGESVAYPFEVLAKERVVNDQVGGTQIVVLFKPGTKSALDAGLFENSRDVGAGVVFNREVGGQLLTFRLDGDQFRDQETGSTWDITGRATSGPLSGKQLQPVVHGNHFWFSWAVFRPETRVYNGS